jgi:hypothetical protein
MHTHTTRQHAADTKLHYSLDRFIRDPALINSTMHRAAISKLVDKTNRISDERDCDRNGQMENVLMALLDVDAQPNHVLTALIYHLYIKSRSNYSLHFLRNLQWWGKTAKGPIFLAPP